LGIAVFERHDPHFMPFWRCKEAAQKPQSWAIFNSL